MINVSNQFKQELNNGHRNYLCYAKITLSDGTVLDLGSDKIWSNGLSVEEEVSSDNSFDIGSAIVNQATLVINNIYEEFSKYDFGGAKVILQVGLKLPDETIEKVKLGTFFVDETKYNGAIITLNCLDEMAKFDKDYSKSTLEYPATFFQIVQDACSVCDVINGIASFPNGDRVIQNRPNDESLTFRQVLQWVGQIACQWFRIDRNNRLVSGWYDMQAYESIGMISGGKISDDLKDAISGGTFGDDLQGSISAGTFGDRDDYHNIYSLNSMQVDTDDVVITGIKVVEFVENVEEEPAVHQVGLDGYVLEISDNKLITKGTGEEIATYLGNQLIGLRFRPMNISFQNNPTIEAGDIALVSDYKGNTYKTLVTGTKFQTGTAQTLVCSAKSATRNSASRYSQATQAYSDARKEMKKQRTEWEKAMEDLSDRINTSSGLYMTKEEQEDGSTIYYMHNKPTLEESMIIWKMTAEAMAVSTDGGKTWNAGLTVDGTLIAKIMNTIGINFDWGVGGELIIQDANGNRVFYVNADTGEVVISPESIGYDYGQNFVTNGAFDDGEKEWVLSGNASIVTDQNNYAYLKCQNGGNSAWITQTLKNIKKGKYRVQFDVEKNEETELPASVNVKIFDTSRFREFTGPEKQTLIFDLESKYDFPSVDLSIWNMSDTAQGDRGINVDNVCVYPLVLDNIKTQIEVNAEGIEAEVKRATEAEGELSAAVKVNAGLIETKVGVGEFGSYMQQYYNRVLIGFNNDSKYVQITAGAISIYDNGVTSSKRRAMFDQNGNHFYRDGYYVGKIGTNKWVNNEAHKGLVFDLEYQGKYMTWAYKKNSSDSIYTAVWTFSRASSIYNYLGLWSGTDIYLNGYKFYLNGDKSRKIYGYNNGIGISDSENIFFEHNATTKCFVSSSGFHINNGSGLTAYNNAILNFYANLNMNGFSILNNSDERLKKNISEPTESALGKLLNLKILQYDWRDTEEHVNMGVIAQQVAEVIPEAVDVSEETGLYSIKMSVFIPYLIRAIQELTSSMRGINLLQEDAYTPKEYTEEEIEEAIMLSRPKEEPEKIEAEPVVVEMEDINGKTSNSKSRRVKRKIQKRNQ